MKLFLLSIGVAFLAFGFVATPRVERIAEATPKPAPATPIPVVVYYVPLTPQPAATPFPVPVRATPMPATPKPFGSSLDKGAYDQRKMKHTPASVYRF